MERNSQFIADKPLLSQAAQRFVAGGQLRDGFIQYLCNTVNEFLVHILIYAEKTFDTEGVDILTLARIRSCWYGCFIIERILFFCIILSPLIFLLIKRTPPPKKGRGYIAVPPYFSQKSPWALGLRNVQIRYLLLFFISFKDTAPVRNSIPIWTKGNFQPMISSLC